MSFCGGGSFYWKCARPPFLLPMGVVHRTREKKKNKRAKSVCSLKSAGKSGKKAPLLASVDRFCVMCCFQCEVNTHRQKRARDYFEVRVNKNESFLFLSTQKKKHKTIASAHKEKSRENKQTERKKNRIFLTKALDAFI